ncbi:hypothetical protein GYA27_03685 [candidate division WWE3 bacterium]|uniref:Uncharacterized protein n=1 Tax=candidate division WWE3 bacterium TaxID=2053526 RepID=A0A7X9DL77_UNCKA|nr:hypothetical protein [candidate division WWE3 bacterium]
MSIDYFVHKKNKINRITKAELDLIEAPDLQIKDVQNDETGDVSFFTASLKDSPFSRGFEYILQENGDYWTYTYDYEDDDFNEFITTIQKLSEVLYLQIDNPQTGEINLKPSEIYGTKMAEFLKIQRNVVNSVPVTLNQTGIEDGFVKTDLELYQENRQGLINLYEPKGYYVDNIMWGKKDGKTLYFCSWVTSVPTVIPPVDQVITLESADKSSKAYLISIKDLEEALGNKFLTVLEPSLHYIIEPVVQEVERNILFSKGKKLQ